MTTERPSPRSFWGMMALIFGLTAYAFLAAGIGGMLTDQPEYIRFAYYLVAGLAWIWPTKKLIFWMGGK